MTTDLRGAWKASDLRVSIALSYIGGHRRYDLSPPRLPDDILSHLPFFPIGAIPGSVAFLLTIISVLVLCILPPYTLLPWSERIAIIGREPGKIKVEEMYHLPKPEREGAVALVVILASLLAPLSTSAGGPFVGSALGLIAGVMILAHERRR